MDALLHVERENFDLIFMDIQMPEIDGIATTRKIRQLPQPICETPVVALTAHALAEERQKLLQSGLNDHLTKPVSEAQLREVLLRWCPHLCSLEEAGSDNNKAGSSGRESSSLQQTSPLNQLVDLKLCLQLANQKPALARDMLSMLLEKIDEDQRLINAAHAAKNWSELLEQVHRLHGANLLHGYSAIKRAPPKPWRHRSSSPTTRRPTRW